MNRGMGSSVPWASPRRRSDNRADSISGMEPRSDLTSHCSNEQTVIAGGRAESSDGQMSNAFSSGLQLPEFAHFTDSTRPVHLSFNSPIPDRIDTVFNSVGSAGSPGVVRNRFAPWISSAIGARARTAVDEAEHFLPTPRDIWIATRVRRSLITVCCVLYIVIAVLLIVAQTGSTGKHKPSSDIYLFRFNLSVLFDPSSDANGTDLELSQALTESLGLHKYYQAGLWGYCEGDTVSDFASCSQPQAFYWFNPVGILLSEMLNTSSLDLPVRVETVLTVLRVVSQIMFATYFVGLILAGILAVGSPLVLLSRWMSLPVGLLAAVTSTSLFIGSALALAMALAYRLAGSALNQVNVLVTLGDTMFGVVWAATVLAFVGLVMHVVLGFVGPSLRDARTGRQTYAELMAPHARIAPHAAEKTAAAAPSIVDRLQDKGRAVVQAFKRKSPWSSPLPLHTLVTREHVIPVVPPPIQQQTPLWGVVS